MIGGGLVGCEVGLYLRAMGKEVTIVEMTDILAREAWCMYRTALLDEVERRGLDVRLHTTCQQITENGIIARTGETEAEIPADTVIYSVGMRSRKDIVEKLTEAAKKANVGQVYLAGDCDHVGKVGDAIPAGHLAALQIH